MGLMIVQFLIENKINANPYCLCCTNEHKRMRMNVHILRISR
jgi:hypothetical protein